MINEYNRARFSQRKMSQREARAEGTLTQTAGEALRPEWRVQELVGLPVCPTLPHRKLHSSSLFSVLCKVFARRPHNVTILGLLNSAILSSSLLAPQSPRIGPFQ